jgi:hypothetical protein
LSQKYFISLPNYSPTLIDVEREETVTEKKKINPQSPIETIKTVVKQTLFGDILGAIKFYSTESI